MLVLHVYSNILTWMYSESLHKFIYLVSPIYIPKKFKAWDAHMSEASLNSTFIWFQVWIR